MTNNELYKDLPISLLERLGWPLNWVELGDDQKLLVEAIMNVRAVEVAVLEEQIIDLMKDLEDCDEQY
jgi:hypothetical protein|tara:strand:- start:25823 stop:26026 length:204 start_codon:yes stop_codon:yes gene_type:complete